ncbi:hypothetical protein Hdeb2414_s0010g00348021 [Helianthus debilis subsp. tardiflorus]
MVTPNRVYGEQVLVAADMSDKWPARSKEVPILLLNGEEVALYQSAFPTFGGAMGVKPLGDGEVFCYEQIKPNFMYARAEVFTTPPVATEGARIPNLRPLRGVTYAGKEIVYLSCEDSVSSSNHELSSWVDVFAGVLRDLGLTTRRRKPKRLQTKKKIIVVGGASGRRGNVTSLKHKFFILILCYC